MSGLFAPQSAYTGFTPYMRLCYQGIFCGFLFVAQAAIQERHDLGAGAGGIGAECGIRSAVRDALLHGPIDRVIVVIAGEHIHEEDLRFVGERHRDGDLAGRLLEGIGAVALVSQLDLVTVLSATVRVSSV